MKVPLSNYSIDEGWKLNRTNYYQEGWLATGNIRGIVGVTFTTSHCKKNMEYPLRTNYNLRGHRSDVILVKWNEPYQKLASCDSSGIIFVWIKYEGRWSIELINDRNTPVTHFSWSHDGRMALICYQDGFVLVGSVAGQRYWSSMLNLESTITCGIWTPDDQQVYFGTTQGQVIVMDVHGAMVSQVQLCSDVGITSMAWSCEKFKMEEGEDTEPGVTNASKRTFVLAVCFQNGYIYLLKSFDDVSPAHINTGLNGGYGLVMEWSNSRELLAVAGTSQYSMNSLDSQGSPVFDNQLKFYTENGTLLYSTRIPNTNTTVSALTWGHNDKRLFIATGNQVHIAWVSRRVASLQLLCRLQIQSSIGSELTLPMLPLPSRIKSLIGNLFAQTIRCCVPDSKYLREFVSRPPICSTRLHCTMIRHDDDVNLTAGSCYTLYLEYLGGLVPLLKGKRISKIRPEFVIFDPQVEEASVFLQFSPDSKSSSGSSHSTIGAGSGRTDSSDSDLDDRCRGSPKTPRKRKPRHKRRHHSHGDKVAHIENEVDELAYVDTLPEEVKLVEVTSNIWGTKFKIHGLAKTVPANLGQVTYKTSLLHLQPRQMTLVITELRDDFPTGPDPNFNPNVFSEDEEDPTLQCIDSKASSPIQRRLSENSSPPIAPMSPRPSRFAQRGKSSSSGTTSRLAETSGQSPLARVESYDDESANESGHEEIVSANNSKPIRPKNIEPPILNTPRPGPSYTSLVTQYSRSSSNSSGQSRHAISPLCCEGSVPTLQSPKNAVAPSDIIFDRPPAGQTTLMSYSSNSDYANNMVQVKNALMSDQCRTTNAHVNPVPLNLNLNLERVDHKHKEKQNSSKKKDILYIDEDTHSPAGNGEMKIKRTPTVASIAPALPDSITRSCSVGYLDSVEMVPSDIALSILRKDAPNKRLVLVDKKPHKKRKHHQEDFRKPKLQQSGKSKSLDSCDLLSHLNSKSAIKDSEKAMPKLLEIHESPAKQTNKKQCKACKINDLGLEKCSNCQYTQTSISSCLDSSNNIMNEKLDNSTSSSSSSISYNKRSPGVKVPHNNTNGSSLQDSKSNINNNNILESLLISKPPHGKSPSKAQTNGTCDQNHHQRKTEFTSFTDSPLFSRKHRFGNKSSSNKSNSNNASINNNEPSSSSKQYNNGSTTNNTSDNRGSPILGRKSAESSGFNLVKQLSEVRRRKKEQQQQQNSNRNGSSTPPNCSNVVEVTPVESKTSVSLHTQALTTLENIISRLRDLDEGRFTPPSSPQRLPRSSPASPAPSKKGKRHQSASPIRHILNSPLLNRRNRKKQPIESSDDEGQTTNGSGEESTLNSKQYRDLETFQKAQLRQKLKRGKIEPNGSPAISVPAPQRREFVMHNKAPMWNENSQVYQLDFGGRVTQESAKNFQIEFRGKQVMQFGRIDGNAYTLDFQYPFSALQAFAVALANVTQRLK
ncbi:unnamed protein product [Hermetia illucens]|uniref:SOCS box domain-containing protein n=1 Tax=Hermetia illucens TaxID=343691 RepID=A0A7R8UZU6_HERIL|nr:unnamed protein product [Hermetia illucens]